MTDHTALLERGELAEQGPPEAVRLPLDLVDPNPNNPRRSLVEVDALASNIQTFGLLQPVTVRRTGDRYELLGGHRRRAAFLMLAEQEPWEAKWRTIPAVVRTADDDDAYLMLLSSQLHSRNWAPREEATALERLAETRTLREVGELVNRGESWVSKRLRVYADSVLSGYVQARQLSAAVAEELLLVEDSGVRREYADQAIGEEWTALHARGVVRKLKLEKEYRHIARMARDLLQLLSNADRTKIPAVATKDLWALRSRIEVLATGRQPVFPTIESAQRAAHVSSKPARGRRTRLKIE